jgi:hypothetical protein
VSGVRPAPGVRLVREIQAPAPGVRLVREIQARVSEGGGYPWSHIGRTRIKIARKLSGDDNSVERRLYYNVDVGRLSFELQK